MSELNFLNKILVQSHKWLKFACLITFALVGIHLIRIFIGWYYLKYSRAKATR